MVSASPSGLRVFGREPDGPAAVGCEGRAADIERLFALFRSNRRLLKALRSSSERLRAIRTYLDGPDCNPRLGRAYYEYCRAALGRAHALVFEPAGSTRRRRADRSRGRGGAPLAERCWRSRRGPPRGPRGGVPRRAPLTVPSGNRRGFAAWLIPQRSSIS